ncbi:uncharacterized protein LY89DRAFT_780822 [Mollisia scopiformis]|uniref:Uncharacterized protein n=1 Tax=Mollisia scopiformis TaxID=149040 RepID=A0A194XFA8_MOLSC|nr:uncharacterized protein LY89DRAFT_780822 [Mollisia scopiformis]KUJ18819.1 hypothetical protein LY89DRAFT_780822 [Mollisia scopiformis]
MAAISSSTSGPSTTQTNPLPLTFDQIRRIRYYRLHGQTLDSEDNIFVPCFNDKYEGRHVGNDHRFAGEMLNSIVRTQRDEWLFIPCSDPNARNGVFKILVCDLIRQLYNPARNYNEALKRGAVFGADNHQRVEDLVFGEESADVAVGEPAMPPIVRTESTSRVAFKVTPAVWHWILQNVGDEWQPAFQKVWEMSMPKFLDERWTICEACNPKESKSGERWTVLPELKRSDLLKDDTWEKFYKEHPELRF